MNLRHRILDGLPLSSEQDDDGYTWQQIALEGAWKGHPMGAFELTRGLLEEIAARANSRHAETPWDYEHASIYKARSGEPWDAAGWSPEMEVRDSSNGAQLWARTKYTDAARAKILAKEIRYVSPVIVFSSKHPKTGELGKPWVPSIALTNVPFLEELPQVALSNLPSFPEIEMKDYTAAFRALGLEPDAEPAAVLSAIEGLQASVQVLCSVREKLQLSDGATEEQFVGAVIALQNPATSDAEVAALRQEVAELRQSEARRSAAAAVSAAMDQGKLTAVGTKMHAWALSYAEADPAGFAAWSESADPVVPTEIKTPNQNPPAVVALSAQERADMEAIGLTEEEFLKFDKIGEERRNAR